MTVAGRAVKRIIDVVVAAVAVVVLSPLLIVVALAIAITMGRPVFFRQQRPGLRGRPFTILKFRTMTEERNAQGELLPDAQRQTRLGQWIRRWSLDEMPQLFNVLRGDLSLVGPRPLLMEYLPLYSPEQARRHEVKPGMTGWAQVNGRNAITWPEKFAHDLWYVEHQSLLLDFRILALTITRGFGGKGIEGHGNIRFTGNSPHDHHTV